MSEFDVRAVVFDLDGLLVDSEPVQIEAWETFLARHHRELTSALLDQLYGLRVWDTARVLIDALDLQLTIDQVVHERDTLFFQFLPGRLVPMPGAREIVQTLNKSRIRLALATSGHRRYVDVVLKELGLTRAFETEVTGDMVENGKPAPEIYLLAAERLNLSPSLCLALEDAPNGIASAKAAGMTCLGIPNQMTSSITGFENADAVLSSLNEVLPWLDRHATDRTENLLTDLER